MAALDEEKGVMKLDDLERHRSTVTRPIHTTYRGHTIYEVPPPTQASTFSLYMLHNGAFKNTPDISYYHR